MIVVRPLEDKQALADLISRQPLQPFLQSWVWGEFQQAYGRRIWRLGAYSGERLVGAMTLIEHRLILDKSYLYVPRGPLADTADVATVLMAEAIKLGKKENAMYVKVDPPLYNFSSDLAQVPGYESGTTLQEPNTLVLDLQPTETNLLASMHSKTRYNIRLAEKHSVQVRWSTADQDHAEYLRLQKETFERQGIRMHPDRYYELMFTALREAGVGELAIAELNGQPLAINLVIWTAQTAVFNHGGSTQAHKEVMAPYLLQWASIKEAKKRGMQAYDFRGIAPENAPDHKLAGVTRFKMGFGGRRVVYPNALNAILDRPWWQIYRLAKRIRGGVDG